MHSAGCGGRMIAGTNRGVEARRLRSASQPAVRSAGRSADHRAEPGLLGSRGRRPDRAGRQGRRVSAYVVMLREHVIDRAEPTLYAGSARSARAGHEVTPVVGYGAMETLEGEAFDGVLIHRFPSIADARAWYE